MAVVRRILRFLQQEAKLDLDLVDVRCECGVGCVHVNAVLPRQRRILKNIRSSSEATLTF